MSIIVEAGTSILVEEALKGLFKVFQIIAFSKTWGEELKASISLLKPTVDQICTNFSDSDSETGKQFKHFQDVLQNGLNDAEKSERLGAFDFRRKYAYGKKFKEFEKSIHYILVTLGPPALHLELQGLTATARNRDQRVERIEHLLEDALRKTTNDQTANAIPNEEMHNSHHSIDCSYQAPVMPKCVGLDEPINVVRELLLRNDVNRVDVRGMGGIGKTTLASALCNDPKIQGFFENNIVFITVTESPNMMEHLNILWDKITKSIRPKFQSIEDARNQLQKFLSVNAPRPTLVVLNDVWSKWDLENLWFKAEGYKTMITTRHEFGILPTDGICVYDMNKLSGTYALELFCFSAFGCHFIPPTQDEELVKQVAAECQGLPLALNIIGSCLRGASLPDWRSAKAKLSRAEPIDEFHRVGVLNCLKKSVDFLDDQLKECFLDLGAFPKGRKFSVDSLLDIWVYVRRIDRDIAFGVLLELARRNLLVLSRDPGNPAISYNCSPELSLSQHDVAQCVRSPAISNDCSSELFFSQHDIMRDLAWNLTRQDGERLFIRGNEARLTTEYRNTRKDESSGIQFLSIHTGAMENRDLCKIDFQEVEALALFFTASEYSLPAFLNSMRNLKVVMIYNYSSKRALLHGLEGFLSFTQIKSVLLERLIVPSLYEYCMAWESLEKFNVCLCEDSKKDKEYLLKLPRMEEINVDHCIDLKELPGKICNLTDIKKLSVTNCHLLQKLPDDLGRLRSLKLLRLSACLSLPWLPPSICDLGELKFLDISNCSRLKYLPSEFYRLSNLETLDMRGCSQLKKLPEAVTKLGSLKHVICDDNTKRQWRSIKASAMPKLTVVVVEEHYNLEWLYN